MSSVATLVAGPGAALTEDLIRTLGTVVDAMRADWLAPGKAADLFCADTDFVPMQLSLKKLLADQPIDVVVQRAKNRRKKFLIADMESTIIEQEMLDELAEVVGLRDKVSEITRRAMNGELDFASALRERVALLRGQPASILDDMAKRITFTPGAAELVRGMKEQGAQCWLVSGGFSCFAEPVAKRLGFDRFYANLLTVKHGKIMGDVEDPILDKYAKQNYLERACDELNVELSETVAVGDGANDVPMLEACMGGGGLGVAYHAKPAVRDVIPQQINHGDLTALLRAQGYKQQI